MHFGEITGSRDAPGGSVRRAPVGGRGAVSAEVHWLSTAGDDAVHGLSGRVAVPARGRLSAVCVDARAARSVSRLPAALAGAFWRTRSVRVRDGGTRGGADAQVQVGALSGAHDG